MSNFLWFITSWYKKYLPGLLKSIPVGEDIEVIDQRKTGWSLARAWNLGLSRIGKYQNVIICNDDIIVKKETGRKITGILNSAGRSLKTLIISAYDINVHGDLGNIWVPSKQSFPAAFCFAVDERLEKEVGQFDENFDPYLLEDCDMYYRMSQKGFDWATGVPVWHIGGGATQSQKARKWREEMLEKSMAYYIQKYGGPPGEERG